MSLKFFCNFFYFSLNHWYTISYYLSIAKRKNVLSVILLEIQKRKNTQMLCKSRAFRICCISKIIKDKTFFFLQLIANKKNRSYHIPMIELGKNKKVTAVLKL